MYLHDRKRFHPIYNQRNYLSGPATTQQNGSLCGTFYSRVIAVKRNKILQTPNIGDTGTGKSAKI